MEIRRSLPMDCRACRNPARHARNATTIDNGQAAASEMECAGTCESSFISSHVQKRLEYSPVAIFYPKQSALMQDFKQCSKVGNEEEEERSEKARPRTTDDGRFAATFHHRLRSLVFGLSRKQVIQNSIRTDCAKREDERGHQVVRHTAWDTRYAREHGGHHIAKVII